VGDPQRIWCLAPDGPGHIVLTTLWSTRQRRTSSPSRHSDAGRLTPGSRGIGRGFVRGGSCQTRNRVGKTPLRSNPISHTGPARDSSRCPEEVVKMCAITSPPGGWPGGQVGGVAPSQQLSWQGLPSHDPTRHLRAKLARWTPLSWPGGSDLGRRRPR
jgi:hypothetical protein